jgi:hypothetical protein
VQWLPEPMVISATQPLKQIEPEPAHKSSQLLISRLLQFSAQIESIPLATHQDLLQSTLVPVTRTVILSPAISEDGAIVTL